MPEQGKALTQPTEEPRTADEEGPLQIADHRIHALLPFSLRNSADGNEEWLAEAKRHLAAQEVSSLFQRLQWEDGVVPQNDTVAAVWSQMQGTGLAIRDFYPHVRQILGERASLVAPQAAGATLVLSKELDFQRDEPRRWLIDLRSAVDVPGKVRCGTLDLCYDGKRLLLQRVECSSSEPMEISPVFNNGALQELGPLRAKERRSWKLHFPGHRLRRAQADQCLCIEFDGRTCAAGLVHAADPTLCTSFELSDPQCLRMRSSGEGKGPKPRNWRICLGKAASARCALRTATQPATQAQSNERETDAPTVMFDLQFDQARLFVFRTGLAILDLTWRYVRLKGDDKSIPANLVLEGNYLLSHD